MTSYEDALAIVLAAAKPRSTEAVGLDGLLGRVLAAPVVAPIDLPPFATTSVDGYGVRSAEVVAGRAMPIAGAVPAGTAPASALGTGKAVRLFTGSQLPDGVDAVMMQEDAEADGGTVRFTTTVTAGENVRERGEEVRAGQAVLPTGTVVTPPVLGVIATLGFDRFEVVLPPNVAVLGTGSELTPPGQTLGPGGVYESNTHGVRAALYGLGIQEVSVDRVSDDPAETEAALRRGLESEVLITCGGVSVGDHDLVRPTLASLGVQERLWRVSIRPGKPFYFGVGPQGQTVFGLPGNPVSALVVFTLFVRPALLRALGAPLPATMPVRVAEDVPSAAGRDDFFRARLEWTREGTVAHRLEAQGSHMLSGLAQADALVRVPAGARGLRAGDLADAIPLRWRIDA